MLISRFLTPLAIAASLFLSARAEAGYIIWPCSGYVTSPYGPRESPCSGCSTFHYGIDIGVGSGTKLGAPANGSFYSWVWSSCGGNIYTISYGSGWTTARTRGKPGPGGDQFKGHGSSRHCRNPGGTASGFGSGYGRYYCRSRP